MKTPIFTVINGVVHVHGDTFLRKVGGKYTYENGTLYYIKGSTTHNAVIDSIEGLFTFPNYPYLLTFSDRYTLE